VPLVSIRNILDSYSKQKIPKETVLECLPDIEENIQYLYELFEDMLSWSKEKRLDAELQKDYVCLKDVTEEICHAYMGAANSKKIKLMNEISESKIVFANERYVKVILRNLISNAIKFNMVEGQIFIRSERNDFFDIVSVKDTGPGITKENLKKIRSGLEITTKGTLNETGTGLGLYFCRDFAIKSGGTLLVESVRGKGSTFSFTLPIQQKQAIKKAG
jgi:signal transduction histidine kinase